MAERTPVQALARTPMFGALDPKALAELGDKEGALRELRGAIDRLPKMNKADVAHAILNRVLRLL